MRPLTDDYIQLRSGDKYFYSNPSPDSIHLDDIAHALALQCRYNGHCSQFYSVAEHCVHVAKWIFDKTGHKRLAFEGLMHDASETYVCDVPRPMKPHLDPKYQDLEYAAEVAVARKFNMTLPWNDFVKEGDMRICLDEYSRLFESTLGPCTWGLASTHEPLGVTIECWAPNEAKARFLDAFKFYTET